MLLEVIPAALMNSISPFFRLPIRVTEATHVTLPSIRHFPAADMHAPVWNVDSTYILNRGDLTTMIVRSKVPKPRKVGNAGFRRRALARVACGRFVAEPNRQADFDAFS